MHLSIAVARRTLAILFVGAALTACSAEVSVGDDDLDREELEASISEELAALSPDAPTPIIDCPEAIEAEVGATGECELTVEGDDAVYPVFVEITGLEDGRASFDVEVGDSPE